MSAPPTREVTALFVEPDSIYKHLGIDAWDRNRDATRWPGGNPVIAHPPCRTWSTLATCVTRATPGEKALAPWAVDQVQRWGGVLEHPAGSRLFAHCGLPVPGGFPDQHGGITIKVNQFHWGHRASKPTLLYIVRSTDIPPEPRRPGRPTHCVTQGHGIRIGHSRFLPRIPDWERQATPVEFARWLIQIASSCRTGRQTAAR